MNIPFSLGKEYDFFGVDNATFKIDDMAIEVREDPSDGWRSYLDSVELVGAEGLVFFATPLDRVVMSDATERDVSGYEMVSVVDGHRWLLFGTEEDLSGYYPSFVFRYEPRAPAAKGGES